MSNTYTRVTIATDGRNVEALLPSHRELGTMMPEILELLDGGFRGDNPRAVTLTPLGSRSLHPDESLHRAGIKDGGILTLDRSDEAIQHSIVYDVAEEVAATKADAPTTWKIPAGRFGTTLLTAILWGCLLLTGVETLILDTAAPWALALVLSVALLIALAATPMRRVPLDAELIVASAIALGAAYLWRLPATGWSAWLVPAWIALAGIAWLISCRQWRAALFTTLTAVVLAGLWWIPLALTSVASLAAATSAVGTMLCLGLAPRVALSISGLNRLDDTTAQGETVPVRSAHGAIRDAHHALAVGIVLVAVSAAISVSLLVTSALTVWNICLGIVVVVLTALAARNMPLVGEKVALLAAAAAGFVAFAHALRAQAPGWVLILAAGVLIVVVLGTRLLQMPEHVQARLRLSARNIETIATLSLIPLVLGAFGVYPELLNTF